MAKKRLFMTVIALVLGLALTAGAVALSASVVDPEQDAVEASAPGEVGGPNYGPHFEATALVEGDESYLIALQRLVTSKATPTTGWSANATIVGRFPVYAPGMDAAPSFYEYKVMDGDEDAGYILVNANRTDILIPEMTTEGETITEEYANVLNITNFRVYRHNLVTTVAKVADTAGAYQPIAAFGVTTGGKVMRFDDPDVGDDLVVRFVLQDERYQRANAERGRMPWVSERMIEYQYADFVPPNMTDINDLLAPRNPAQSLADVGPYWLASTFSVGWRTPKWYQTVNSSGYPSGCGATAWSMVYAYWHQFKNRPNLFSYRNLNDYDNYNQIENTFVETAQFTIARELGTVFGSAGGKFGMVYPWNMYKGLDYARSVGYHPTNSNFTKEDVGAHDKWNLVSYEIRSNRPAILFIHDDGIGVGNHYVVVEGVQKFTWGVDSLGYNCNFGWGTTRKWIYDLDGEPDFSVLDAMAVTGIPL